MPDRSLQRDGRRGATRMELNVRPLKKEYTKAGISPKGGSWRKGAPDLSAGDGNGVDREGSSGDARAFAISVSSGSLDGEAIYIGTIMVTRMSSGTKSNSLKKCDLVGANVTKKYGIIG